MQRAKKQLLYEDEKKEEKKEVPEKKKRGRPRKGTLEGKKEDVEKENIPPAAETKRSKLDQEVSAGMQLVLHPAMIVL